MKTSKHLQHESRYAAYWFPPAVTFLLRLLLLLGGGALSGGCGWSRGGRRCRRLRRGGRHALSHCIACWHGHAHCRREDASIKPRKRKGSIWAWKYQVLLPLFLSSSQSATSSLSKPAWASACRHSTQLYFLFRHFGGPSLKKKINQCLNDSLFYCSIDVAGDLHVLFARCKNTTLEALLHKGFHWIHLHMCTFLLNIK